MNCPNLTSVVTDIAGMKKVQIRFAVQEDLHRISELCQLHADFEGALEAVKLVDDFEYLIRLEELLFRASPAVFCLVADVENIIEGYATFMPQFSTWGATRYLYLDCLFLTQEVRGMGIGKKIMLSIKAEAKKFGCLEIQWQTPDFNNDAIQFYQKLGAKPKMKQRFSWSLKDEYE